jgi:hypothetical protein
MSTPNFSIYLDSLLSVNRGEDGDFPEMAMHNLEDWGFIEVLDDKVAITHKGINVLEFYLKNREFMKSSTSQIQEAVLKNYPE